MSNNKKKKEPLFKEFPPISMKEWEKIIRKDLNGADYKKKLRWHTGEGVDVLPFYRREDLDESTYLNAISDNKTDNSWEVRAPIFEQNIEEANKSAQKALNSGADALQIRQRFHCSGNSITALEGTPITNQHQISKLFKNIALAETPIHFDCGLAASALLGMLWNESQALGLNNQKLQASFLYDPFTFSLRNGQQSKKIEDIKQDINQLAAFSAKNLPKIRPLGIDARIYSNAGGTMVQELGFALAAASEYLTILTDAGFNVDDSSHFLHFNFAIGSNYFLEIAKFRAFRLLWKNLISAFGSAANENNLYVHAETSSWNKTLYDPYINMLRTTTEGMSAVIGGCDALTILPFDQHFRGPDDFSERIARNQQIIMSEEAYFDKVIDPGAGSYYIEKLTDAFGKEAWSLFQKVEQEGGLVASIENGTVQSTVKDSQQKRYQDIAKRNKIFVGVNKYTNAEGTMTNEIHPGYNIQSFKQTGQGLKFKIQHSPEDLAQAFLDGAQLNELIPHLIDFDGKKIAAIHSSRGSKAFEELRLATENHKPIPTVLILPLGDEKMRNMRARFAGDLFGSAGYHIEQSAGFENIGEALRAVNEILPDIVVVCSSDQEYQHIVSAICDGIQALEDGPMLILAGFPKKDVEAYNKAGIDEYIHVQCNVLEVLERCQQKLLN